MQDTFNAYYKLQPEIREEHQVAASHKGKRPYGERLLEDDATQQTRAFTQLDELAAAVATLETGKVLSEEIAKNPALDQSMENGTEPPPQAQGQLNKALRHAVKAGMEQAQDVQEQMISWGFDGSGLTQMPLGERIELARQLMPPRFKRIALLIGRLRNLARSKQGGSLKHLRDEYHSITLGDHIGRLLPVEMAALSDPLRKLDFGRRLLEHKLLEYEVRPIQREGKGPVICLIDASGSMSGNPIEWASAVGLALMDTARRQKRDFAAVFFDTQILAEFRFERGKAPPEEIFRFATIGANGGTSYEVPLSWALDVQAESKLRHADIVMISDGECAVSDEFFNRLMKTKKDRGLRIMSILIGGIPTELSKWSDRVWAVTAPDDEAAGEMFAELV
ncbi:MAG: VWA domain-containing protein [Thermaerobacter sp.]|nr:VWA domain-containing protein [Thermaerobacter sp.]